MSCTWSSPNLLRITLHSFFHRHFVSLNLWKWQSSLDLLLQGVFYSLQPNKGQVLGLCFSMLIACSLLTWNQYLPTNQSIKYIYTSKNSCMCGGKIPKCKCFIFFPLKSIVLLVLFGGSLTRRDIVLVKVGMNVCKLFIIYIYMGTIGAWLNNGWCWWLN